jgi:hypothetical protein
MTDDGRSIRRISGNFQESQAAMSELADAIAGSAQITSKPDIICVGRDPGVGGKFSISMTTNITNL